MDAQQTINLLQKKLSESEQNTSRFQCIFTSIADAVVFADRERKIVMVNPSLEKIFGYQEKELLGKTTDILYASKEEYERQGRIRFHLI